MPDKRKGHLNRSGWEEIIPVRPPESFRERTVRAARMAQEGRDRDA